MMSPAWLLDILAALMLVLAAVSATRLATARLPANRLSAAEPTGSDWSSSSGRTPQSIALARQSGAQHVFDYKGDDIAAENREADQWPGR